MLDANSQALVYIYARETRQQADIAKVLTFDEARRIAVNVTKLPGLLSGKQAMPNSLHVHHRTTSTFRCLHLLCGPTSLK